MPTAHLHHVYSAALAASGDQAVAERVIVGARGGGDRAALVERAVLLAIRTAPDDAFAPMRADEREVVALARLAGMVASPVLGGLRPALEELCARYSHRGLRVTLEGDARPPEVAPDVAAVVLRVLSEALTNVERHAGASRVSLEAGDRMVIAEMDFSHPPEGSADPWREQLDAALARGLTGLWYARFPVDTTTEDHDAMMGFEREWHRMSRDRPVVTICPFIVGDHAAPALVEQVAERHTGILAPANGGYDRVR